MGRQLKKTFKLWAPKTKNGGVGTWIDGIGGGTPVLATTQLEAEEYSDLESEERAVRVEVTVREIQSRKR